MHIPFVNLNNQHLSIREELLRKVESIIDKSNFILGEYVSNFESDYSKFSDSKFSVGVSNGTDALKICLRALDIRENDEVIIPANTFHATALAVVSVGAKPILVEPNSGTYNIDAKTILPSISHKTKAIIPVHLYGNPCNMNEIMSLAKEKSLFVIEDNAQAQGAIVCGKKTGSFGDINATSFYPTKNLGALGDAGAITTDNHGLYDRALLLRNLGSAQKNVHEIIGQNARMDALQAALLSVKLRYLEQWNQERITIADKYIERLKNHPEIILPNKSLYGKHVFHLFVIRTTKRNLLQSFLAKKNIQTQIHYPTPIHLQPAFKFLGYKKGNFPITENLSETILSLPLYIGMTENEIDYVCECIIDFYK